MDTKHKGPDRNLPADEGRKNDPFRREESAQQPGVNTYSSSDTDDVNQHLTETASDNFRTEPFGEDADATFDEVDKRKQKNID